MKIDVVEHPLIKQKLTIRRDEKTGTKEFTELLDEISLLVMYEVTRDWEVESVNVKTPVQECTGYRLKNSKVNIIPILRAGLGFVNGVLRLIPTAKVGHVGLYRDPETLKPVEYYCKLPSDKNAQTVVVDPMLATGGSAVAAIELLKEKGHKNISFLCLVAAPEGVKVLNEAHPEVEIYTAALDECLNDHGYIVPGLGDAGDRIFGTL